ncbi:MAG: ABC transporter ATP-binding protein [Synechococcus sp. MED-G133]|nr:MAG: ABC transporter ATP-binding protein [Synechococcus sp. MED-G133]
MTEPHSSIKGQLTAKALSYRYGTALTLERVDLELHPGTLTALVGPNGAGKSTLLHLLQGRLNPSEGSFRCNGSIALMPQRAAIDWTFPITVREMVRLGQSNRHDPTTAEAILERVGMGDMRTRRLNQLSGGQQQRVLLARALMQQSDVLLLDEPCSAIDPPSREHLLGVMRQQASSGQTLLVSSHDWGSALDSYDRVVVLDRKVLAAGSPAEVRDKLNDMTCLMGSHCCG